MAAGSASPPRPIFAEAKNPRAVFVLAPPRSGTTLLRVMLAGHPRLFAPPELELLSFATMAERNRTFRERDSFWLEGLIRAVMEIRGCEVEEARQVIAEHEQDGMSTLHFYGILQKWLGDRLLVDKTPSYTLEIDTLERAEAGFESPVYIHLLRHPHGMIRSFEDARLDQIFFRHEHSFSRRELAELIWVVSHQNVLEFLSRVPAERQHRVRFEDLVRHPRRVLRGICGALDLDLHPDMLRPYERDSRRMSDGLLPESRMLGDVKFHQHADIDPTVADRWRWEIEEDFLGDVTWELAVSLGYERMRDTWSRIEPAERVAGEPLPLSFAQQRLWFIDRLRPGDPSYNMPTAVRLQGSLDTAALAAALTEVVRRHETLRTTFGERSGEPVQVVAQRARPAMPRVELSCLPGARRAGEMSRLAQEEAWRPFDLARGPLLRATLLALGPQHHAVLLTLHHIVTDGWSMGILVRELGTLYAAFAAGQLSPLPELALQYADYAVWQRRRFASGSQERELGYWRECLRELPPALELPIDHPRPAVLSGTGSTLDFHLPAALAEALQALSRLQGATLFMTFLAAFTTLLGRYTGQDDVAVGSPVANRGRPEVEGLIGFFVNTLVLRVDLAGEPSFLDLLERVREVTRGAFAHQDLPFERLVEELQPERSLSRTPLFQVMFMLQNAPAEVAAAPNLLLSTMALKGTTAKFDLLLNLVERRFGLHGAWEVSRDLFDLPTVLRMTGHFETLLDAVAADPARRAAELPMLTAAERAQLSTEWSDTASEQAPEPSIEGLFTAQAVRTPEAVAVACEGEALTYRELDAWADRIAARLRREGLGLDALVAICAERSLELVAGLLGILKSGAAYVPIDPGYPSERLSYMLEDSAASVLLTQEQLLERLPERRSGQGVRIILLEERAGRIAASPPGVALRARPESLAYMIYTSGSTGRPKGAMNSHRAVCNRLLWMQEAFALTPTDRVLQKTPFSFDVSVWEFFWPLMVGAQLAVAKPGGHQDPEYLADLIAREQITTLHFVPSMLRAFLGAQGLERGTALRRVISSGEALPADLSRLFFARVGEVELHNLYGPTEAAVDVTWWDCQPGSREVSVPIGRPIANTAVHLLDRRLLPVPIGVPGELHIGGIQPARGYWRRPELTAERFIPDPWGEPGARLYKTGDLCRWRRDGAVEYLERIDRQVKIRGFRIEPGEVEVALAGCPGVRQAAVVVREELVGGLLAAFMVPEPGASLSVGEVREFLRSRLPDYMVPGRFVALEALPLTPSGKVDRRALVAASAQEGRPGEDGGGTPRTPVEELLVGLFCEVLELSRVGTEESFFELGGHSLLATRLVSRLPGTLGVELPLQAIFEAPTVATLAERVERELRVGTGVRTPPIRPAPRHRPLPLSFAQQRLWFLQSLAPESAAYNMAMAVALTGTLNRAALGAAWRELIRRHEVLRTRFELAEGDPLQVIDSAQPFPLPLVDLTALPEESRRPELLRLAADEASRPFDLARGPVLRAFLAAEGKERHALLLTLHHIAGDGWSLSVLVRELTTLYQAFSEGRRSPLAELEIQYADFAVWQRGWLAGDLLRAEMDWWREQLGGEEAVRADALDLPLDRPRRAVRSFRGGDRRLSLSHRLSQELEAFSRQRGVTVFMVLLAGFQTLLSRYTGRLDLRVGTPIAGRNRVEIEGLIGFFVNTLVLRTYLAGTPGFAELVRRVREVTLAAYAHQDLPFEKLVEELQPERDLALTPLFQVMFELHNTPVSAVQVPGLRLEPLATGNATAKFDLTLSFMPAGGAIGLLLQYDRELFDAVTVQRLVEHLQRLLGAAVADPDCSYAALPLLSEPERRQVLGEWGEGRRTPAAPDVCVPDLLARQAQRTPEAVAATCGDERLLYAELDGLVLRLARRLAARGIGPESVVALLAERGLPLLAAVVGVLRTGAAWLPLDPRHPATRQAAVLSQAGAAAVLVQRDLAGDLSQAIAGRGAPPVLDLEEMLAPGSTESVAIGRAMPENLAYVIFTSGSTGVPKGAMIEHRGMLNHLRAKVEDLDLTAADVVAQTASQCFDISVWQMLAPLLLGGRVEIADDATAHDPERLAVFVRESGATVLEVVPSVLRAMLDSRVKDLGGLRWLMVTGEAFPPDLARRCLERFPEVPLVNAYGPTECSDDVTHQVLREAPEPDAVHLPIGRPLPNLRLRVLDRFGGPQPCGVVGELAVGGAGVGRGYLGEPGRTAEVFVPDGEGEAGARLYRTGDLGYWLTNGSLEFLGRIDDQVKVRGFRIELGEIEAALALCPGVREAAVTAPEGKGRERRLVAHVAASGASTKDLQQSLRELLPEYMIPSVFVFLEALPKTANGKLDRQALVAPEDEVDSYQAPRTPVEEVLAGIWSHLLGVERVGTEDDFFALGGHSLTATRVVSRIREAFGFEVPLRALFEAPTVRGLARLVEGAMRGGDDPEIPPIRPVPRDRPLPLSFAQQRLWFLHQLEPGSTAYNVPWPVRLQGALEIPVLQGALDEIVRRHETLRTTFSVGPDGEPVQVVAVPHPVPTPIVDLAGLPEAVSCLEMRRLIAEEARRPFDLTRGPLLRVVLMRLGPEQHAASFTTHHIVSDGWSRGVLLRDLDTIYRDLLQGLPPALPELPVQYADFAIWQRHWLSGEALERELSYWRERLADPPPALELPADRPRSALRTASGAAETLFLSPAHTARLRALSHQHGATLFMSLLAAFQALLSRCSGQEDLCLGTTIAGRNLLETEGLIGFFVNTLVLRTDLAGAPNFAELLGRVRTTALGAFSHQELPFEKLVEELRPQRDLDHTPLFQVLFELQNAPRLGVETLSLNIAPLEPETTSVKFDLAASAIEEGDVLRIVLQYSRGLFEASTIRRLAGHFQAVIEGMAADPRRPLAELALLSEAERHQILAEWSDSESTVQGVWAAAPGLLIERARLTPDATAASCGSESLTYGELAARAGALAARLTHRSAGTETLVAVLAERGLPLLAGFVGAVAAGAIYLPLDPAHPPARWRQILESSGTKFVLCERRLIADLDQALRDLPPEMRPAVLGLEGALRRDGSADTAAVRPLPAQLAYVIYTSGSTGAPKGVMLEHRGMLNHLWAKVADLGLTSADVVAQTASQCFDISLWQMLAPLLVGGQVRIAVDGVAHDPERLLAFTRDEGLTVLEVVPSVLRGMLGSQMKGGLPSLRWLMVTGETFPPELCRRWLESYPGVPVVNAYGPTECSDDVTHQMLRETPAPEEVRLPIGHPLLNLRLRVLDRFGMAQPCGVPGELAVGGVGVGRGYLGDPARTAEVFVPESEGLEPGARLYRTGDLGRWLPDGSLELLGRLDSQVKVRGFRIELEEIEAVLMSRPGVIEAAVTAPLGRGGERRLVAYVVAPEGGAEELRRSLRERLPESMVPTAWVFAAALPKTTNGKLDRKALKPPEEEAVAEESPRTPVEEVLAGIWSELLGLERVGPGDDFFLLGGHSLLATQVVSRIREAFGAEVPLRELFESPTLAGLARAVEAARRAGVGGAPLLVPAPRDAPLPLSFAQQRLWFLDRMVPDNPFYNIYSALPLSGALDVDVLRCSAREIVRRHEALRTRFASLADQPVQVVEPEVRLDVPCVDLQALGEERRRQELARLSWEEGRRPFDLSQSPMLRLHVVRTAPESHVLLLNVHHIAADGWSVRVLIDELVILYEAFSRGEPSPLPELPIQYADFAVWQRRWLQGEVFQRQLTYWMNRLQGILESPLELPTDHPRPAVESFRGSRELWRLRSPLVRELRAMARGHRATLFMVLLAAYKGLFSRYSRQEDVAIGAGIANRNRQEIEGLIGFFVNTLVLRTDLAGLPGFEEVLRRVRQTTMESYDHQDLPFEMLVEEMRPERSLNRNPLVQVMLAFQNYQHAARGPRELSLTAPQGELGETGTAKFDLALFVFEQGEELLLRMEYSTDLFERATIRRMLGHLAKLLRSAVERHDVPVAELPLLSYAERAQVLLEWNDTAVPCPQEPMVHELVSLYARRRPEALAVSGGGGRLTYGELESRSNRLAHHLRCLGVGPEVRVAICTERTPERVAGIVAVLKAGGAYVSLDPAYPKERLAWLLEDAAAPVLLTQASLVPMLPETRALVLRLDEDWAAVEGDEGSPPQSGVMPENLSYVVYTSGSTGRPKGVETPHAGLMNLVRWHQRCYQVEASDRATQVASPAFDASIWELWPYLAAGASVHIPDEETRLSSPGMVRWWDEVGITLAYLPTPLAEGVLAEPVPESVAVRALIIGGDRLHRRPRPDVRFRLMNHYGPAEYSVNSTVVEVAAGGEEDALLPTIGRAVDNTQLYVLDRSQGPMPVGVPGELYVAGVGLARGYSGRPDLTAEKFVPDPFGERGSRMYRTGDLARLLPDGDLDFLGRLDFQVKMRGLRIELGEIETVLGQHPAVRDAAVLVREDHPGDKRLVAYVVQAPDLEIGAEVRDEHVVQWSGFFDEVYRREPAEADPTFNIIGWDSTYSGLPLPAAEMQEWLADTIDHIQALAPRRVLEIGCGTGLLLFRLAARCESYWGTDISAESIRFLESQLARQPEKLAGVHLEQRPADRFDGFAPASFDAVVMNSVVQYFPGVDYLVAVLEKAVEVVRPGGAIFLGDVRSLPLQKVFHTGIELFQADPALEIPELRRRVEARALSDAELQLSPALFYALQRELPRITRVEVYPKRGRSKNELTQFRYQVVLRVDGAAAAPEPIPWLDWRQEGLSLASLGRRLSGEQPAMLGLRNVPNRRVAELAEAARLLFAGEGIETAADLSQRAAAADGVEPQDVWDLAGELPYEVELGWASPQADGGFDAVLRRRGPGAPGVPRVPDLATWLPAPELPPARQAWSAYANSPLEGRFVRQAVPALQAWLGERLPAYMVPSAFMLLDALPLTPNGKVDRRALPPPVVGSDEEFVAPRSPVEEAMARIWADLLRLDCVGVRDDFFELGGHSLLASRVVARAREEFGVEVPLRALFESPTVEALARLVLGLQMDAHGTGELDDVLAELEGMSDEEAELWLADAAMEEADA